MGDQTKTASECGQMAMPGAARCVGIIGVLLARRIVMSGLDPVSMQRGMGCARVTRENAMEIGTGLAP
jgi:hypothetical protein